MVFSSGNDTEIASLSIGTSLSLSGFFKDLQSLEKIKLPELNIPVGLGIKSFQASRAVIERQLTSLTTPHQIKITVDGKQALAELGQIRKEISALSKPVTTSINIPQQPKPKSGRSSTSAGVQTVLQPFKNAETYLAQLEQQALKSRAAIAKASGDLGAQKEVALLQEALRYKEQLRKIDGSIFTSGDVARAKQMAEELNRINVQGISQKFNQLQQKSIQASLPKTVIQQPDPIANIQSLTKKVSANLSGAGVGSDVEARLESIRKQIAAINNNEIEIQVDPGQALRQLQVINARIEALRGKSITFGLNSQQVQAEISEITQDLNKLTQSAEASSGGIGALGASLIGNLAAVAAQSAISAISSLIGKVKDLGVSTILTSGQMRQLVIGLEAVSGSASEADKILDGLSQFEGNFKTAELIDLAKRLESFGIEGDRVIGTIDALGNVAAGTGSDISGIALAYSQVLSKDQLYAEELLQFAERGIPLLQVLADQFGVTTAEMRELIQDGKVGFADVEKAFQAMTSEGGKFYGLLEKQGQTTLGKITRLQNNFTKAQTQLGNAIDPAVSGFLQFLIDVLNEAGDNVRNLDRLSASAKRLGDAFAGNKELTQALGEQIGRLADLTLEALIDGLDAVTGYLEENPEQIEAMVTGFVDLAESIDGAVRLTVEFAEGLGAAVGKVDELIKRFDILSNLNLPDISTKAIGGPIGLIAGPAADLVSKFLGSNSGNADRPDYKNMADDVLPGIGGVLGDKSSLDSIKKAGDDLSDELKALSKDIQDFFKSITQQTEDLQIDIDRMNIESKFRQIQTEFQSNLSGFSDSFLGDFLGTINNILEINQQRVKRQNELAQQKLEASRKAQENDDRAAELQGRATTANTPVGKGGSGTYSTGLLSAQEFGAERHYGGHAGQDIDISGNDSFSAILGGEVVAIDEDPTYGRFVRIQTALPGVVETIAEGLETLVEVGDRVAPGQVVQRGEGSSGVIHYQIDVNGSPVDPIEFLSQKGLANRSGTEVTFNYSGLAAPGAAATTSSVSRPDATSSAAPGAATTVNIDLGSLFEGGSDSTVARVIGISEGTRTESGGFTDAYGGHTDPGNAAHNMGSFSYQGGASSPEAADAAWLSQLRDVLPQFVNEAKAAGLDPNDPRLLFNFLDLYTQSPAAATAVGGFLDQLPTIASQGVSDESILNARVQSYYDPSGRLDAPGLGNDPNRVRADQSRRLQAVNSGLSANNLSGGGVSGGTIDTSAVSAAQSQSQQNLAAYTQAAEQSASVDDAYFAQQLENEKEKALQQFDDTLQDVSDQGTEVYRQQEEILLNTFSDTPLGGVLQQLRSQTQEFDDAVTENQERLRSVANTIADAEGTLSFNERFPGQIAPEIIAKIESGLPELRKEYEELQALVDTDAAVRNQQRQDIIDDYIKQQSEGLLGLQRQTQSAQEELTIARISDPTIRQLLEGQSRINQTVADYEQQINQLRQEGVEYEQKLADLQAQGVQLSEDELAIAQQTIALNQQETAELEKQRDLAVETQREQQRALVQQFTGDQSQRLFQSQLQSLQTTGANRFEINTFQRQNARLEENKRYLEESSRIQAFQAQGLLSPQESQSLLSAESQINQFNLQGINTQFADLATTINTDVFGAFEGFGSTFSQVLSQARSGKDILEGLGDAFESMAGKILENLLNLGIEWANSEIRSLFFPQQGNNATASASGILNAASALGGLSGGFGNAIGGVGKAATPKGGGGSDWLSIAISAATSLTGGGFGFAEGGKIPGNFTGQVDRVPAMVTEGEFVINRLATQKHLPLLEAINSNSLPRFATGGMVGGMPSAPRIPRSPVAPSMPTMPREAANSMGDRAGNSEVTLKTQIINNVEYATVAEVQSAFLRAKKEGAVEGKNMAFRQMQQSPNTRRGLGMQ